MIHVMIVDDHPVVRNGLSSIFESEDGFEVVGEAGNGAEAVRRAAGLKPDVILMDLRMPELDGVGAIRELVKQGSPCRVLVLTTYDSDTDVLAAIEAGATGFLLKDAPRSELLRGVEAAARGEAVLAPVVASKVLAQMRAPAEETLSDRELEVLTLVSHGASNQDVAGRLFISEATVKTHLRHIYEKLGASDRASAVAAGYNLGLLTPERR
jgi:DNA-binding NarL/FixJ family response regulator